jgi:hypothetical protein
MRVAVVALLIMVSTESIAAARAGQPVPVATLSIAIDVQGSDGLPPDLGVLVVTPLILEVDERACGGPDFLAEFSAETPGFVYPSDAVPVLDAAVFRVDVEVPVAVDGTDCEYTIDPANNEDAQGNPTGELLLLCYRTIDVIAEGSEGEQALNLAGYPTGAAVSPASGEVVAVTATYADACSEVRLEVDGLGDRDVHVRIDAEPVDSADLAVGCDYGDWEYFVRSSAGQLLLQQPVPAGCVATLALTAEGCTITPPVDRFTVEHPVTTRQLSAACAAPAPVPAEPAFTG